MSPISGRTDKSRGRSFSGYVAGRMGSMFDLDRAALYAARHGISRIDLEETLRSGELAAGHSLSGEWVIYPEPLEQWIDSHS